METRHVIFGAVFLAVFTFGSLNIISDGRVGHAVSAQLPGHSVASNSEPEISIEENVTLEPGATKSVNAEIAKIISYTNPTLFNRDEAQIDVDAKLEPSPGMVQQSLPPSWVYDHVEPEILMNISLNSSESMAPGNYSFNVTAESGMDIEAREVSESFSVRVLNSSG